ncbi:MAG: hypothetical protein IJ214_13105 [Clostridia bacterium]|nr:hypothetical protein [Clostridia bacterium]
MQKRNPHIARALFWDALILLALSCFELFTRLDAMWGPLKMFVNMAIGESVPLSRAVTYVDFTIFHTPLYMLGCAALALWTLLSRRTRRVCAMLILPAAALTAVGFALRLTLFGELTRTLKMLPLVILLALCVLHVIFRPARRQAPPIDSLPIRHRRSQHRRAA